MGNSIRVLLVDDDTVVAEMAATYLKRANDRIEVVVESGPTSALDRVTGDEQIDCVVSDYDMPESNGLEFLDGVRQSDPDLPFILFTGKGSEEIASEAISAGVTDYLQKGTETEQYEVLANRVENAVTQHHAQVEVRETKQKIEALHDVATQAVACTSAQDIYDLAVEAAEETLAFDLCAVDVVEGGELVPQAVSKGVPTDGYYDTTNIDADDKLAARTYRTGDSSLVHDVRETAVVPAESEYRSALTVAIGEYGVLQAVSEEPNAFDDDDRELAEILAAHLEEALARLQSETELRAERDRFAALFENLPNAVVRYDLSGSEPIAASLNPAFEEVFGWSNSDIVGDSVDEYILPEDCHDEGRSLNHEVQRGNRIEGVEVHRNTTDGVRDFLLHTAPVTEDGGTEAFAIYVDITEQKERERKLASQNERLEEFASVVSHDLRNPLNVAHGRFEMLAEEIDDDNEHVPPLSRALDRMDALVGDLLALARRGQLVDESERVSLVNAANTAWTTVQTDTATLELDGDLVVDADDARFRELLENLFRNSVRHSSEDVTIEVGALDDGTGFYVQDDGPGIPESLRERVFDHGYTTSDEGTGFGLAIVSSIAEAHGWEVRLEENAAGGARFVFTQVSVHEQPVGR
ncbi:hybrid sensor histidine kinase/response regulator [Halorussus halophilus]|uniref:hybrid sensor histidine kinase/response regulator n=1 Tax=Halorussus halophilus TaxID=2650975 RepID=UPI001300E02A|nr:ATP-binding protein [Halorussus halophilus]